MNLGNAFNQIMVLFLIMLVGAAAKKFRAVDDSLQKNITDFIFNVSLPALLISSMRFEFSQELLKSSVILFLVSIGLYVLSTVFAFVIVRFIKADELSKKIYRFILIFSNIGFMGYPVVDAIYGHKGLFYTAIFNITYNFYVWTMGIFIISSRTEDKKIGLKNVINPGTVAIIIGLLMFIFSIPLPKPIVSMLDMVGNTTTPLSMILIGFMLANFSIKKAFASPMVFVMAMFRLIIIPLIFLLILKPFISDSLVFDVPVILMAMPAAAITAMFAEKFGGDTYLASQNVFITTLLSVITIPLMVYILNVL
jgi:Predicted permeases